MLPKNDPIFYHHHNPLSMLNFWNTFYFFRQIPAKSKYQIVKNLLNEDLLILKNGKGIY